ncbi:MAG: hypothetical protein U0271_07780 [Polyangiaceae bacterium]
MLKKAIAIGLVSVFTAGCETKCDELVGVLTDCVSGNTGADETDPTDPGTDPECSAEDDACATCILESKLDLCSQYGEAIQTCRDTGECQ